MLLMFDEKHKKHLAFLLDIGSDGLFVNLYTEASYWEPGIAVACSQGVQSSVCWGPGFGGPLAVILSLPLIQEGQLSVSGERMCTILVNRLED